MNNLGKTIIDCRSYNVRIIEGDKIIPVDSLQWREFDGYCLELTLDEIVQRIKPAATLYVWEESGLEGKIYLYNNYGDKKWYEHGKTKGYA